MDRSTQPRKEGPGGEMLCGRRFSHFPFFFFFFFFLHNYHFSIVSEGNHGPASSVGTRRRSRNPAICRVARCLPWAAVVFRSIQSHPRAREGVSPRGCEFCRLRRHSPFS